MLAKDPKIPIITIHQAKGLEFDYVFMASLEDHVFPTYWARQKGDIEEEKRLFYVAMTRAKRGCISAGTKDLAGRAICRAAS